jgi:hydroxyethylthiazole kinase-like uncharacterized protein yjeF
MTRAGQAAAALALKLLPENKHTASVLVLAGPGNNGGDAFEVAAHLAQAGVRVSVLSFANPIKQPEDAKQALHLAHRSPARFRDSSTQEAALSVIHSTAWHLVVDGLFGIGLSKPLSGNWLGLVESINRLPCPVLAIDVPSGLDVDTGAVVGRPDGIAVRASHTITFIAGKPGLYTFQGRDYAGKVSVATLDIDARHYPTPPCRLNDPELFAHTLKARKHDSHKGTYGNVAILGGALGMAGAVILAARTALFSGAGRVYAVFLEEAPAYDSAQPELMCRRADAFDMATAVLVAGPGLGQSRAAHDWLSLVLRAPQPIVLDADALNLIAAEPGLRQRLRLRRAPSLATPHPLEAARLLGIRSDEIQADRINATRRLAKELNATVILKGSGSIIAESNGMAHINPTGNPVLATAGTGDILAGLCGALLAQGLPIKEAALAASWLHGKAADDMAAFLPGGMGLAASELLGAIRTHLNQTAAQQTS